MITPTTRFGAHSVDIKGIMTISFDLAAMDSATSDTASNWGSFNCSFVAAAEANGAPCDTNAAYASNSRAVAAERASDSRNSESNQVIAQTKKSPQLHPLSNSPSASLDLLATVTINESATGRMVGASTAASSGDNPILAQLYHPSGRLRRNGHNSTTPGWKHPTPTPTPQLNAIEDATAGMIGAPAAASSRDILTLAQLYRPRRQKRNNVESHIICQDSNACSTPSCSITSSEAAEQIWQEIQNDIGNTDEDDWSFNGSPPLNSNSPKISLCSTESDIVFSERIYEDVAERDLKKTKTSHDE